MMHGQTRRALVGAAVVVLLGLMSAPRLLFGDD